MKITYILSLLVFVSCAEKVKEKAKEQKEEVVIEKMATAVQAREAVNSSEDSSKNETAQSFETVIGLIKLKRLPLSDSTNFDSFMEEGDYQDVNAEVLKLKKLYPDFYKEEENYRAISNYKIVVSETYYSVVVTVLIGDYEMETSLINYTPTGELIDFKRIAYDEVRRGWSREITTIMDNKLTISHIDLEEEKKIKNVLFRIEANGKFKLVSKTDHLIDSALEQLNLDISKVKMDILVIKEMPNNPEETIIVIPEYADDNDDEHHYGLHSYTLIVNSETGKIKYKYFENVKRNNWISDAIRLEKITIDTAPYYLADDKRAFGIRVHFYGSSQANPYINEIISLYTKTTDSLHKVLHNYSVERYSGAWNADCVGEFYEEEKVLVLSKDKTNDYYNIIVKNKITETKNFLDKSDNCDATDKVTMQTSTLTFNKKEYQ